MTTFAEAQQLVDQLPPNEQLRLIAYLAQRLVLPPISSLAATDALTRYRQFVAEFQAAHPDITGFAEQLEADRRERDNLISGH